MNYAKERGYRDGREYGEAFHTQIARGDIDTFDIARRRVKDYDFSSADEKQYIEAFFSGAIGMGKPNMSDPTKKRVRAYTMWPESYGGYLNHMPQGGIMHTTPWFHTHKELDNWIVDHPGFHGGKKIKIEEGSAIRKSRSNPRSKTAVEKFFNAYVETALWSSTDYSDESGGEPLDKNYTADDIAKETLDQMMSDSVDFLEAHEDDIGTEYARAGHDFWLTRNRHGAGFWDGDWPEPEAKRLTDSAHAYGEVNLYVGDDGQIHD